MTRSEKYIEEASRTRATRDGDYSLSPRMYNLLHAAIGISTEGGELLDAFKKTLYYGNKLDLPNVKEEVGDILWYMSIILDELDCTFEEAMDINIDKLKARYTDKFSENEANNRNLDAEREILENGGTRLNKEVSNEMPKEGSGYVSVSEAKRLLSQYDFSVSDILDMLEEMGDIVTEKLDGGKRKLIGINGITDSAGNPKFKLNYIRAVIEQLN